MKKVRLVLLVTAAIGTGTIMVSTAQAAPAGMSGQLGAAADRLNLVEQTQFIFEGREYCWYDDGWHGPGWYWCGYALRQGFGWGGSAGWHHWDRHHPPVHGPGSSHNPRPAPPVSKPPRHPSHPAARKPKQNGSGTSPRPK